MYADYQDFAAGFARRCRARRNEEEAAQHEMDELTKPATASSAADVCKANGASALVHKVNDNARVDGSGIAHKTRDGTDDSSSVELTSRTRNVTATDASKMPWTDWVDARMEDRLDALGEDVGKVIGLKARSVRDQLEEGDAAIRRELELLKREFAILKHEVGVERGLRDLREEVAEARKQVPKLPAIVDEFDARQTDLEAEQARLERELAKTKERVSKLRVEQGLTDFGLRELEKQTAASKAGAIVMELETSTARFALRGIHPEAAKALREFASQVVDAEDGGAILGRELIQTAGTA